MSKMIRQHIPILEWNNDCECWLLKCRICGTILWDSSDDNEECHPQPPTLGINVRDGTGVGERVG